MIEPGAFSKMIKLEFLSLDENKLTEVRTDMWTGLEALATLYLDYNEITHIENGAFAGAPHLGSLSLASNNITNITEGTFKGIGNLQALRLYKNQLVEINMDMFKETPNLTSLSIDGNSITTIEAGSFTTKMKYLYLHDNNLTTLSSEIFDLNGGHPVYLDISLSGNPLFCDGRLCWVKRGLQDRWLWFAGSGDTYKPQCANFPSTTWDNVDLNCP